MKAVISGVIATGGLLLSAVSAAQTPAQEQTRTQVAAQAQQVTVVGCIVREADYRRSRDAGKGGIAGTGVGVQNEFILTNASLAPAAGSPASPAAVGTSGAGTTPAYELTGANEKQAESFVGRRVEISGMLKPAESGTAGPTGGPTAGQPPAGIDVVSQDLKLRELEITSVRATPGTCPAQ